MTHSPLVVLAVSAVLATGLVGLVRRYAMRGALLDHANERSSHVGATPRGGGLGLVAAFVAVWLWALPSVSPEAIVALAGVAIVALVGWVDDHGGVAVPIRLVAHLGGGVAVAWLARDGLGLPDGLVWIGPLWWIFWAVSAVNVVNFMDGIDGLIGSQAAIYGLSVSLLAMPGGVAASAGFALVGCAIGFLLWNWPPAKIFLGDVGSGAIGLLCVLSGVYLLREGATSIVQAYLPLYPIFLDATVTLVRRVRRGAKVTEAHREHLYQRLANGGHGHALVTCGYGLAALVGVGIVSLETPFATSAYTLVVAVVGLWLDRKISRRDQTALAGVKT